MQILHHWDQLQQRDQTRPLYLVIGAFDGIHCGHQALIRQAVEQARATGGEAWLLTFNPHPSRVLRPTAAPPLLTSTAHKLHVLAGLNLDGVIVHPFDYELAARSPEDFVAACCAAMPGLHTVLVGVNWRFGHRAAGDVQLLQELSKSYHFRVCVPDPVPWQDEMISSTRIRQAIESGRLQDAEQMLGRPFSLLGRVTTGKQYGRELGFPTANIQLDDEARPPTGVYAVYGIHQQQRFNGAAYLGIRPTAHGEHQHHLLEVHFFDVNLDLYGYEIEVFFVQYIRADQHFSDHQALKAQIARDVEQSRQVFVA